MASGVISTTFSTSTSTGDSSMATLIIADTPCSDVRLSSCENLESCVVQILPSALCYDNSHSTWTLGSTLSCMITSTPLIVPTATFPQNECPLGMTMAKTAVHPGGGWCCPLGFKWASDSCQSSITRGMAPQISDACAPENTIAPATGITQFDKRTIETTAFHSEIRSLNDISSPTPGTLSISPRKPAETAVTAIFVEAIYLSGQTFPTSALIMPSSYTDGMSPSNSGNVSSETMPKHELSDLAKVAIGLGSGVVGSILILLGAFLIRRHRKRRLYETRKDEMAASPNPESYTIKEPKPGGIGNTRKTIIERPRFQYELTATSSPTTPVFESSYLCRPERERLKNKVTTPGVVSEERVRSEVPSFSGTTFYSANHFELFELDTHIQPLETEASTRRNNRASSQVLPWQAGIYDYLDPCNNTNKPEEGEHTSIS
ncbi:hypothetical protein F5B22DRAFT_621537 [Xylaria bambusicola]|uniref:uncharacterized protein n=1 Tax=Xylaria bambusicola TaxID=326684 RepID=UPI0020086660|nr:uncharacterized protein F5B22DRAFT_621537 [Xylaria bambusicola]KAI0508295.1 hypothetical protein F5B22DRAFT_621537 [Xylaria bambusicola]